MMVAEKKVSVMHPTVLGCQTTAHRERDTKRRALHIHVRGESGPQNLTCATCDVPSARCHRSGSTHSSPMLHVCGAWMVA